MPSRRTTTSFLAVATVICFVVVLNPTSAAAANPSITVSPEVGTVGSTMTIEGNGFPPSTEVVFGWTSQNASWKIEAIPTPQVTGLDSSALIYRLGSTTSDSSGSFSVQIAVPSDYGGAHSIQAYAVNGTAISPVAAFTLAPSFKVSPSEGPDGTPIHVFAMGLGIGSYSTSYQLIWDNSYAGYMDAVATGGTANFTIYASGTPGTHFISIYEGANGPAYMDPQLAPGGPRGVGYYFPPYVPFHANFTVTAQNVVMKAGSSSAAAYTAPLEAPVTTALLVTLAGGVLFLARKSPEERRAISKALVAIVIVLLVAVGGVGLYMTAGQSGATNSVSEIQSGTGPQVTFAPVATVSRPQITVPVNNATSGPRISVTPNIASVGDKVTVRGMGFAPNAQLPIVYTTREGSNLRGYQVVEKPLRNVTADSQGSFSFTMNVHSDLGGVHFIAAGNLTEKSNGTLFIQRTARLSTTHGPYGTQIQIIMQGVGWDFNTNIAAFDYDNSFVGYGCGFNSGGNVTFTIPATGAPGIHTIDVYPSIWWGPVNFQNPLPVVYRLPLLTPYDHPELMPSFHFTFLMTPG